MKYTYEGTPSKEIIKNYKKENGKIIVTFLDNSKYEMSLTEENERKLLDMMLKQAEEFIQNTPTHNYKVNLKASSAFAFMCGMTIPIFNELQDDVSSKDQFLLNFLVKVIGITVVANILMAKHTFNKLNCIEKYKIYLEVRSRLERVDNPNLYNGIKREEKLNINSLDNYSLKDLKNIRSNLERYENFSSFSYASSQDKTLSKNRQN